MHQLLGAVPGDGACITTDGPLDHHAEDGCLQTPCLSAKHQAAAYPLITVNGGWPVESGPCGGGIEGGGSRP
jgi:hypothetical protein